MPRRGGEAQGSARQPAGRLEFCAYSKGLPSHQTVRMQFTATQKRASAWLAIATLCGLLLWWLGPVLTPFVVAAVLAYALNPVVNRIDAAFGGRMPRVVGVLVVETLFLLALAGLLLMLVPILAKELPLLREQVPLLLDRMNTAVQPWLAQMGIGLRLDVDSVKAFVLKYLNTNVEDALGSLLASLKLGGSVALTIVGNGILIPVVTFYLLLDWDAFVRRIVGLVPPMVRPAYDRFMDEADQVLGQYLRGQLLVMMVLAVYYSASLALFGLDLAFPIGIFTGLAIFVPYVGFGIGLVLAFLSALLQFTVAKAILMVTIVYGVGQLVESLYLTPRLLGDRIGLHPLAVIFMLLAFGQLFGFVGVLIALPVSAVLLVALRRIEATYRASPLFRGRVGGSDA